MENKQLRKAISSLPCVNCGLEGSSQCAHSNSHTFGKGTGLKATDIASFPLCCDRLGIQGCHSKWDQSVPGFIGSKEYLELRWIVSTYMKLMKLGYLKVTYKG